MDLVTTRSSQSHIHIQTHPAWQMQIACENEHEIPLLTEIANHIGKCAPHESRVIRLDALAFSLVCTEGMRIFVATDGRLSRRSGRNEFFPMPALPPLRESKELSTRYLHCSL